jgi:hypothetical protein
MPRISLPRIATFIWARHTSKQKRIGDMAYGRVDYAGHCHGALPPAAARVFIKICVQQHNEKKKHKGRYIHGIFYTPLN